MSTAMDLYLTGSDSLQEMLDIDIKSEIDILVGGGHNDLSAFGFNELPSMELEDATEIRWISSSNSSSHSNSNFSFEIAGDYGAMVNPNAVMPVLSLARNNSTRSPSPVFETSHLTFSPSSLQISSPESLTTNSNQKGNEEVEVVKKVEAVKRNILRPGKHASIVKILTPPTPKPKAPPPPIVEPPKNTGNKNGRVYPKPAYSYSCLIAMALKNSRTGNLPVSEIYNFMCRHFPYFKTAPNGWKNSVRHNLSLNKCFEKIEKPAVNGSQRKGCLWAMNPTKIAKMDDEMHKWSKKDPNGIRKAMTRPYNLEALERGDLKFTYKEADNFENFGDSCGSAESEEGSDTEPENNLEAETEFVEIKGENDFDAEVADSVYEEVDCDEEQLLHMEMVLAQKELFEFDRNSNSNKRRRMFIIQK